VPDVASGSCAPNRFKETFGERANRAVVILNPCTEIHPSAPAPQSLAERPLADVADYEDFQDGRPQWRGIAWGIQT
jgi:hypothetical protein